jgi:hypothetical protein
MICGMTSGEFNAWAEAADIDPRAYRLSSSAEGEVYVMEPSSGGWAVFYSERDNRNDESWYPAEAQALDDLKGRLERDPATRRDEYRVAAVRRWFSERDFLVSFEEGGGFVWASLTRTASGSVVTRFW